MKRRGFFGRVFGAVAAAVGFKALRGPVPAVSPGKFNHELWAKKEIMDVTVEATPLWNKLNGPALARAHAKIEAMSREALT